MYLSFVSLQLICVFSVTKQALLVKDRLLKKKTEYEELEASLIETEKELQSLCGPFTNGKPNSAVLSGSRVVQQTSVPLNVQQWKTNSSPMVRAFYILEHFVVTVTAVHIIIPPQTAVWGV